MPIAFSCTCGKAFEVKDEFAGRRSKCPACGAALQVPRPPEPEPASDVELIEDDPPTAEFVEDEPPTAGPARPAKARVKAVAVDDDTPPPPASSSPTSRPRIKGAGVEDAPPAEAAPEPKKKGKKKRRKSGKETGLAALYMAEARAEHERDEARARAGRGDDEPGGFTMLGVHVTAGVAGGAGMLLIGLLSILLLLAFKEVAMMDPRIMFGAIGCTALGGITLMKVLLFGESEE